MASLVAGEISPDTNDVEEISKIHSMAQSQIYY